MKKQFKEQLRLCKIYKEECNKFKETICIKNTNPRTSMVIYFGSLQMRYFISDFLRVCKEFKEFNVFKDAFDSHDFIPVNDLWLFCDNVGNSKDSVQQLIDIDFMNSESSTFSLCNMEPETYIKILNLWERNIDDLIQRLENIKDTWYCNNKHLEQQGYYINKEEMAIYKLINIPSAEREHFILRKHTRNNKGHDVISQIKLQPDFIRDSIKDEVFLERRLGEDYPECFL